MAVKRGDAAREAVRNRIIEAFGADYVGTQDKKIYVNAKDGDNGEVIQFAITMTMPKAPIAAPVGLAEVEGVSPTTSQVSVTLSDADRAQIEALKQRLGIG